VGPESWSAVGRVAKTQVQVLNSQSHLLYYEIFDTSASADRGRLDLKSQENLWGTRHGPSELNQCTMKARRKKYTKKNRADLTYSLPN